MEYPQYVNFEAKKERQGSPQGGFFAPDQDPIDIGPCGTSRISIRDQKVTLNRVRRIDNV